MMTPEEILAGDDLHNLIATSHGGGEDRHRPEECEACRAMEAWEKVSPGCAPSCMCLDSHWCPVHRGPPSPEPAQEPEGERWILTRISQPPAASPTEEK